MTFTLRDRLQSFFGDAGYRMIEPPILQSADLFLNLAGEDMRRRLYVTQSATGSEKCLRPEFTIPVCRVHAETGDPGREGRYAYIGPAFRQSRKDGPDEFLQAGIEHLGSAAQPVAEIDADMLKRAVDAVGLFGIEDVQIRIGDIGLLAAFLKALGLSGKAAALIRRSFGTDRTLQSAIDRLGKSGRTLGISAELLRQSDPEAAKALVTELMAETGWRQTGRRTAGDIAHRFVEKVRIGQAISREQIDLIERYRAVRGTPHEAAEAFRALAADASMDMAGALELFFERAKAIDAIGLNTGRVGASGAFGRRLDYYTGFVFELHRPHAADVSGYLVGGGRYDALMRLLGAAGDVPAIGFSMWIDRLVKAGGGRS